MDRQDIDALLIGALYGELSPAEEARLTAHLESHPTDRGALDDLKTARQAVRESRIFELQVDPPQHLSALLLQEAHRRAPKRVVATEEKEGWFARFLRSFVAHPAMAAAATLVLVVGVAGTLYMRKGADFAKSEVSTDEMRERQLGGDQAPAVAAQNAAPTGATGLAEAPAEGSAAAAPTEGPAVDNDAYRAGLYDKNSDGDSFRKRDEAEAKKQKAERQQVAKEDSATDRWAGERKPAATAPSKKSASNGIIVSTARPEPKELENAKDSGAVVGGAKGNTFSLDGADDSFARNSNTRAGAGGGANAQGAGTATTSTGSTITTAPQAPTNQAPGRAPATSAGPYAQPPPPPPAADKSVAQKTPSSPTTPPAGNAPKAEPKPAEKPSDAKIATKAAPEKSADAPAQESARRADSALVAWAKGEHNAVKALVAKGQCESAAKRALGVSNKAPDYYSQFMSTDRALKSCMAYINAERDKDAEKSAKSRAQKRVNADEVQSAPAPAPTK